MTELPIPLTPPDCELQDFAFMPLDVSRLRDSELASNQTPEACWAAVLIWCASWHQVPAASIPDDDKWIATQARYAIRGKIDKEWANVREGALRGWVKCSDGRLYHAVIAEKAVDAWKSKLIQRWKSECGRIKKHNQRHKTTHAVLEYDAWINAGRPQGQPLSVPEDNSDSAEDNSGDTPSKGQGEGQGQGQGQLTSKATTGTGAHDSNIIGTIPADVCHSVGEICIAMRKYGINANPGHPATVELAAQGVLLSTLHEACRQAKAKKPNEAIPPNFVIGFIRNWAADAAAMNVAGARPPQHRTTKDQSRASAMNSLGLGGHHDEQPFTFDAATGRAAD